MSYKKITCQELLQETHTFMKMKTKESHTQLAPKQPRCILAHIAGCLLFLFPQGLTQTFIIPLKISVPIPTTILLFMKFE